MRLVFALGFITVAMVGFYSIFTTDSDVDRVFAVPFTFAAICIAYLFLSLKKKKS